MLVCFNIRMLTHGVMFIVDKHLNNYKHGLRSLESFLTKMLFAGISVEFQFVEVVSVLLSRPGSSAQLVRVQLLQLFWIHFFPHTNETILGHLGQRAMLP